jgi:hypothetical protein
MKVDGSESRGLECYAFSSYLPVLSIAGREEPRFGMPTADLRGGCWTAGTGG